MRKIYIYQDRYYLGRLHLREFGVNSFVDYQNEILTLRSSPKRAVINFVIVSAIVLIRTSISFFFTDGVKKILPAHGSYIMLLVIFLAGN